MTACSYDTTFRVVIQGRRCSAGPITEAIKKRLIRARLGRRRSSKKCVSELKFEVRSTSVASAACCVPGLLC